MVSGGGSTVDQGEVDRHSQLSARWWDPHGLHGLNTLRIPFFVEHLCSEKERKSTTPLANKKILDIGCAGGIVSEALAKLGAEVTGVDPSPQLIAAAKEHCELDPKVAANKPQYLCSTIEEHSQERAEYYDAVVATEVVDHVADVDLFLKHCAATLKPRGKIFVTAPNRTRWAQFFFIILQEYIIKTIPKGLHEYDKFVTPAEVTAILKKYDCFVKESRGMLHFPLIDKFQWVFFQSVWYALVATKLP